MSKVLSPCVDVCTFKLKDRCIGCTMTKKQKKKFGKIKSNKDKIRFIEILIERQKELGRHAYWRKIYTRKCEKKGVRLPFPA